MTSHSLPLNVVLGLLRNEVDALEHVGDVVNASLLNTESVGCLVEVDHTVVCRHEERHEALGEETERRVIARLLARRLHASVRTATVVGRRARGRVRRFPS